MKAGLARQVPACFHSIRMRRQARRSIPRRRNCSRSRLRSLGPSRCAGALLGTWMGDTGGKSGRRPGRHLQVEASGPGNAASVQRGFVSRRTRWGCDLEVWVRAVGRLTPSTFPQVAVGGLARLGSRRLPRMRSLADEITGAPTRKALRRRARRGRLCATAHTLSIHHDLPRAHARPSRRTCE